MERYELKEGKVAIVDDELKLDLTSSWKVLSLPENPQNGKEIKPGIRITIYNFPDGSSRISLDKGGVFHGEWRLLYPSGELKIQAFYYEGLPHGPFRFYLKEGILLVENWFFEGLKNGKSRSFYAEGGKCSLEQFIEGEPHGPQIFWYPDGTLKTLMEYEHGLLEGKVNLFHPNGNLFRALKCQKGNVLTADDE